jgi:peroxiredoxin Q/BCP
MGNESTVVGQLEPGQQAPDFVIPNQAGLMRSLEDFQGKGLILYFFPAAASPGCSKEASNFDENFERFSELGYQIVGISPDKVERLKGFHEVLELKFDLLSDFSTAVHRQFGAWGDKSVFGRLYKGVLRSTMIIDPDGKILHAMYGVKSTGHVEHLLELLDS